MSTHNLCFDGKLTKINFKLSSNTHLQCSVFLRVVVKVLNMLQGKALMVKFHTE